jgi:hypothetical protein
MTPKISGWGQCVKISEIVKAIFARSNLLQRIEFKIYSSICISFSKIRKLILILLRLILFSSMQSCHLMEKMDLEECSLITDSTIIHLAMNCARLEKLVSGTLKQ